jgi:cell division septal protein FtsQ
MSKQKENNFIKKFLWFALLISFLGISGWVLFFSNYTEIREIQIKSDRVDKKAVEEVFDNLRKEKYLNFISKNNFFLFPKESFESQIKNEFELVREIIFENDFPETFRVKIIEREAVVVWCSQEKCFLMDNRGVIFREISEDEKEGRFKNYLIILDDSLREGLSGDKIEDNQLARFTVDIEKKLNDKLGLKIKREISTPSLLAEEIRLTTEGGWQLYLDTKQNIEEKLSLLKEVLEGDIENKENLEYIDLRVTGKIIYRTKD